MKSDHCLVITTTANQADARDLAAKILRQRLAACIQIFAIESHYMWHDKVQQEHEFALHIKTRADNFEGLCTAIRQLHSYDVPEIIRLDITDGFKPYLDWIDQVSAAQ